MQPSGVADRVVGNRDAVRPESAATGAPAHPSRPLRTHGGAPVGGGGRRAFFAAALVSVTAVSAAAQNDAVNVIEDLMDAGAQWFTGRPPDDVAVTLDIPTLENWQAFCKSVDEAMRSGSIEDLAWILPEIKTALGYLETVPGSRPYTDWLKQRLDYVEMADEALRSLPQMKGRERPRPSVRPRTSLRPPVLVKPPPLSPAAERQLGQTIRSQTAWMRKLSPRPPPPEARTLIPTLKEAFVSEGVPPQWVWVAEVESSLDPDAQSPSGAVGLFQFMPDTARRFGLRTGFVDERKSPQKSARAAARYLKALHRQFGSWPLTFAAYNAGEGCLSKALKAQRAQTFDEVAPALPAETQMYVPKVMATVALREGVDPHSLPPPAGSN